MSKAASHINGGEAFDSSQKTAIHELKSRQTLEDAYNEK